MKIFGYNFKFVFRHRFENEDDAEKLIHKFTMWGEWRLGFFFRRNRLVGKKEFSKPKKWGKNLVNEIMIGIDLLICKMWVTVSKGAMTLKLRDGEKKSK